MTSRTFFVIGVDSIAGLSARLAATTPLGEAVIATQIDLTSRHARLIWPTIRRGHRHFAPAIKMLNDPTSADREQTAE